MTRIRLAPQARDDLDAIWLFIARESENTETATRTIDSVTGKFGLFARFPYIGKSLESAQRPNIRTFPVGNYVIFYSVRQAEIRILRILHASRDALAIFTEE
jgi:toxin ParE1/3/4